MTAIATVSILINILFVSIAAGYYIGRRVKEHHPGTRGGWLPRSVEIETADARVVDPEWEQLTPVQRRLQWQRFNAVHKTAFEAALKAKKDAS